jgi:hypothetical protein
MDFLEIQQLILNYLRRPEDEIGDEVNSAINRVCKRAASMHDFVVLEQRVEGTYTSLAVTVPLSTLFSSVSVRTVKSVQLLANTGDDYGDPLKIISYTELQKFRQRQRDAAGGTASVLPYSTYIAFIQGDSNLAENLGLYPVPDGTRYLLGEVSTWPTELSADTDTNFLLTNFPNYVLFAVCAELFFYLRSDDRAKFTDEAVTREWQYVLNWDAKLRATTGTQL